MPHDVMLAEFDLVGLVMATSVVSVLMWFLLNALKRGHQIRIQRLRITIEEIRRDDACDDEIRAGLDEALAHLKRAEESGPLRGRGPLSAAHGAMGALVARLEQERDDAAGE